MHFRVRATVIAALATFCAVASQAYAQVVMVRPVPRVVEVRSPGRVSDVEAAQRLFEKYTSFTIDDYRRASEENRILVPEANSDVERARAHSLSARERARKLIQAQARGEVRAVDVQDTCDGPDEAIRNEASTRLRIALRSNAEKVVFDHSKREDAVQATLVKILEKCAQILDRPKDQIAGYVLAILRNGAIDDARKRNRRPEDASLDDSDNEKPVSWSAWEPTESTSHKQLLTLIFERLSPRERDVILNWATGMTAPEIANNLCVSADRIKELKAQIVAKAAPLKSEF
jgi:RNA polymerase sigma factor (sigma-70 family)